MGTSGLNDINSWVLSKVLDAHIIGTKEEVDLTRLITNLHDSMRDQPCFTVGSFGEGFSRICSDVDRMLIYPRTVVMDTETCQFRLVDTKSMVILLLRQGRCRPGYTTLQINPLRHVQYDNFFMNSVVPFMNLKLLSSDIFRENFMKAMHGKGFEGVSTGPSIKIQVDHRSWDMVYTFPCVTWPKDAEEWISRTRLFGWPTKTMISTVIQNGCHIVPIGDKCSDDTLLQWRISFATAEKYLVHSFNHTQFKVYGLLKYLLHQIKFRLKQKTGDDDIVCSYFMKTVMFFAVENSPHSFWKEENIFLCFRFCFSILLDWVHSRYCPNYFIKTNNMFERKIHGENRLKLLHILRELHQMNWLCLQTGIGRWSSLLELMRSTTREELLYLHSPCEMEYRKDIHLSSHLTDTAYGVNAKQVMKKLLNSSTDTEELVVYFHMVCVLAYFSSNSLQQELKKTVGNKARYKSLRKCKHWLSASFGTNILYLASFHYLTGNYRKALELSSIVRWSISLDCDSTENKKKYQEAYCGKGYSTIYKMKKAYSMDLMFRANAQQLCVPHLDLEVERQSPLPLIIPPKEYALFLLFLCYHTLGDKRGCLDSLYDLVHYKNSDDGKHKDWIVHVMIGICCQLQGEYRQAIIAYQRSLKLNTIRNPARERIKALVHFLKIQK